ncbi:MAG: thioredoxin-dependent thiol peroxidase [Bacteroidetes bacterium]|nr:thioredoxin-dependent thiol peroxidase [Bacteroidota bacterium]
MTHLTTGKKAPAFKGIDQAGHVRELKSYLGKKLLIYFYPKDDTPACTAQACDLRDNYKKLIKAGYQVIGISPDEVKRHVKFISKYDLPFDLISDPEHKIAEKYGVWGEKTLYGRKYMGIIRTSFLLDEKGKITEIIEKVDTKNHSAQVLKTEAKESKNKA